MFERITFDPTILGGRACIRGMRISVALIVGQIADGASRDEVLSDYPDLEPDDIRQALEYAASLAEEPALDDSQRKELQRRVAESDASPDAGIPWEQVKDQLLSRLRARSP